MKIESALENILGDHYTRVILAPAQLRRLTLDKVLEVCEQVALFKQESESLSEEKQEQLGSLFVEAMSLKSKLERAKNMHSQMVRDLMDKKLLSEKDAEDSVQIIDPKLNTAEDLDWEDKSSSVLKDVLLSTYCTNATILSGLIAEGAEIDIEEQESLNQDPKVLNHLKKTAFDQACMLYLNSHNPNYSELSYVDFKESEENKKQIIFTYANAKKMDRLHFPRFAEFIHPKTGESVKVLSSHHHVKKWTVSCEVAGKKVTVKLPIYFGEVLGQIN